MSNRFTGPFTFGMIIVIRPLALVQIAEQIETFPKNLQKHLVTIMNTNQVKVRRYMKKQVYSRNAFQAEVNLDYTISIAAVEYFCE